MTHAACSGQDQDQAFGQDGAHSAEFQRPQRCAQVGADRLAGPVAVGLVLVVVLVRMGWSPVRGGRCGHRRG